MRHLRNGIFPTSVILLGLAAFPGHARSIDSGGTASYVIETRAAAPNRIGEFTLKTATSVPGTSAIFEYELSGHPEIRLRLTMRGTGGIPHEEALQMGIDLFGGDVHMGVLSPSQNRDIRTTKPAVFSIPDTGSDTAPPLVGRSFGAHYTMLQAFTNERVAIQARDFVFNRGMNLVHLSVAAAESRLDAPTFEALADRAARELVPALFISNIGRCGHRADRSNLLCLATRADAQAQEPVNAEIVTVEYEPNDWKEQ